MEKKNLIDVANLFTPPISRRKPKKKKKRHGCEDAADAGRLLSLGMSKRREIKDPLLTSDESEGEEAAVIQNLDAWMTDDEEIRSQPQKPKSTTTSKTSNTYVTCLTSQNAQDNLIIYELSEEECDGVAVINKGVMQAEISEDEDDVSVVQQVANTPVAEVSSCEKVQVWLEKLNTSEHHAVRNLVMEPQALEQPISQGSSTGYPLTEKSQNRDSSFCATSRLNSSSDSLPTTVPVFNSQASSRSSSFYSKDRVPWSKSQPPPSKERKKPTSERKLSDRSGLTIWSDARSTQESFRLHIETSEENQENSFSSLIPIHSAKAPTRVSTTSGSGSDSLPETVAKMSDIYASSEQSKPLVDLTNHTVFNPGLCSTMRDSVFSFPSADLEYRKSLDRTLEKTPIVKKKSQEKKASLLERREVILISSDEEYNAESSDCISASSEDEREKRTIVTKTPNKTRLVDVMTSDSDSEDEQGTVQPQVVPETDDESEKSTQFEDQNSSCSKPSPQQQRVKSPMARAKSDSESEDDEELVNQFFNKQKERKNAITPRKEPEEYELSENSFIVEDDVIYLDSDISDDEKQQETFSPSFYLRVLNDQRRANASSDVTIKEANWNEARKLYTQVQTPKGKNKTESKTPRRGKELGTPQRRTLGFLASLSFDEPTKDCHPDAVPFLKNFKLRKDDLAEKLYELYNNTVFDCKLDSEMSITWNNRLTSTAGLCYNQRKRVDGGGTVRVCRIELSGKILQNAAQMRDTLIHEMCHAATWIIDEVIGGHGPVWKKWTRRANRTHPDLPEIKRCHNYKVEKAYTYRCTKCQYSFGRGTKSLDTERKVCGYCKGKFELIENNKKGPKREPNAFALFVKENYNTVRQSDMKHKDVMQLLSQKFKSTKL